HQHRKRCRPYEGWHHRESRHHEYEIRDEYEQRAEREPAGPPGLRENSAVEHAGNRVCMSFDAEVLAIYRCEPNVVEAGCRRTDEHDGILQFRRWHFAM